MSLAAAAVCASLVAVSLLMCWLYPLPQPKPYSLVITDRHGTFLGAFLANDGTWRLRTAPHEIPERIKRILIEKEDRYFYYHPGFNLLAIGRALVQNIKAGRIISGGSTISMQVARMLNPKERTYWNKFVEIFQALQLEWKYSKDEILQMYLSLVPLGGNIEGLKSASLLYYRTPINRLNVAQLLDLILIPNDPNGLRPDRRPDLLYRMRCERGSDFLRRGLLSRQDSVVIWRTPAGVSRATIGLTGPHFCLRIKDQHPRSSEVQSSLDSRIQKTVEALVTNHLRPWKARGVKNSAAIVIDNRTMEIVSYVGSESFEDSLASGQVDAVRALRSPGSTLKPFLYALVMDRGILTPKTRLLDVPYDLDGYAAENYEGTYSGFVSAEEALRRSLNIPMIRLLKEVGLTSFGATLDHVGFASLQPQKPRLGLSMIVGGCGVTLEELTTAYASLARGGLYSRARYLKNNDTTGLPSERAISEAAAYMITEILSGIDRPDLPNNFESSVNLPMVAFKTGTSYGRRDAWCVGYSAEFTVGVWIGNVTGKGVPDLVGSRSATPLLIDIFNAISSPHQKTILPIPSDVGVRDVCATSGKLATKWCSHVIQDLFSKRHSLNQFCDIDKEYMVSIDSKKHYCVMCVKKHPHKLAVYQEYPPELLTFWKATGRPFRTPPVHDPTCEQLPQGSGPQILSPIHDMTYLLTHGEEKIAFYATSGVDVKSHIWYVDDRLLGHKRAGQKFFLKLQDGKHHISCLDERGRLSSIMIVVQSL